MTEQEPSVQTTRELLDAGVHYRQIVARTKRGELAKVRQGAFSEARSDDKLGRHQQLIAATYDRLGAKTVLSHDSAAALLGLPVRNDRLDKVRATRSRGTLGGGNSTTWAHIVAATWSDEDVIEINGYRMTSLARTAADLAREQSRDDAVITLDAALHRALRRDGGDERLRAEIVDQLNRSRHRRGYAAAVHALGLANALSESPLETRSRLCFHDRRLPTPVLQLEIRDEHGVFVGRVDFAWPELNLVGEADGKVKYDRLLRPGETPFDVVIREKQRDIRLQELDWNVARWFDENLDRPDALCRRLTNLMQR